MSASPRADWNASLAGAFLAGVTASFLMGLPWSRAFGLLAILFGGVATIYFGAALSTGRREPIWMEGLAACAFIALAALGLWRSPLFLIVGYLAHGLWDLAHHRSGLQTRITAWWPLFCLVYDWVIAGAICLRWLHG